MKTIILKQNGDFVEHEGESGVTLTLVNASADGGYGTVLIEMGIEKMSHAISILLEFLNLFDEQLKGTGVVENALLRFLQDSGRLKDGVLHLKHVSKKTKP